MSDKDVHLLFASNRWEVKDTLVNDLLTGTNLVCDRYAFSGTSYTSAKEVPGLDFEWCLKADEGLIEPDLVVYIDVDMTTISTRAGFGGERYEKTDFQTKVRDKF